MVTCMTAMVECLVDANKTENIISLQTGVKVLTSVSKVSISFNKTKELDALAKPSNKRTLLGKSFKNITMNNTIGVGAGKNGAKYLRSFDDAWPENRSLKSAVRLSSRKISKESNVIEELAKSADWEEGREDPSKEVFRKVKLHSDSEGFRSPLKQINNQLRRCVN